MSACFSGSSPSDFCGWVSGPNTRGTFSIIWGSLATIWLCTWTSLCLNLPERKSLRGWRFVLHKFRWQLFAIFFPEVLVALTAEQWVSARQSVRWFKEMGNDEWTIQHGFFADMGGVMIAPRGSEVFPVDSYQLAYLVRNKYLPMPYIELDEIRAVNKADGLARLVTLVQMAGYTLSCTGRAIQRIGLSPLELETLAFILCTMHTFFFWYHKPLDPARAITIPLDATVQDICSAQQLESYTHTPFDFIKPPPDPKSLVAPFWFGVKSLYPNSDSSQSKPVKSIANSTVTPSDGMSWPLTIYLLVFQLMYYGLHIAVAWNIRAAFPTRTEFLIWEVSNAIDMGLILMYMVGLGVGHHLSPWLARFLFDRDASRVLDVAAMLPRWGQQLLHGPFVFGYVIGRIFVLVEALTTMRVLPQILYQDVNWTASLPHLGN